MLKTKTQKFICFFIASVIVFSAAFTVNSAGYFSRESDPNFDWWSESLIYSDLLFHKMQPNVNSEFTKSLTPTKLAETYGGEFQDYENPVRTAYQNNEDIYKESDFDDYTSNIVIQRFFFRFFDDILPISNTLKIHLFHFLNCLLLAISISVILCWIIKVLDSFKIGIGILIVLSLFAPNLIMYGKNLYWCAWTLFLPCVMMILLFESKRFQKAKHKIALVSICALFGIIIKCLFYFEFISVVMISMMIPVIFYLLNQDSDKYPLKNKAGFFITVSVSAIIGFLLVFAVKFIILKNYYGNFTEALDALLGNLQDRLLGNISTESTEILKSANAPIFNVLKIMLAKPFINAKYIFSITQLGLILVTLIASVSLILINKKTHSLSKKHIYWIACCWISVLAPISWFVMAKPHTYIHNHHCSVTWFVIFDIMALSLIALLIYQIIKLIKEKATAQK